MHRSVSDAYKEESDMMNDNGQDLRPAQEAMARTEEELLADFGVALAGGSDLTRDGNLEDLRDRARDWFDRNLEELKKRICGQPALDNLTDGATDVAAVADLLAGMMDKLPVYTVAAILLKRGIHTLCF